MGSMRIGRRPIVGAVVGLFTTVIQEPVEVSDQAGDTIRQDRVARHLMFDPLTTRTVKMAQGIFQQVGGVHDLIGSQPNRAVRPFHAVGPGLHASET